MNEVSTMNKNNKITMYLIGTNPDKATEFDREDALKMAEEYNMNYHELNANKTEDCDKLMRDAIGQIC